MSLFNLDPDCYDYYLKKETLEKKTICIVCFYMFFSF